LLCGTTLAAGVIVVSTSANAQCAFPPGVGNDNYACTSGTSTGGLSDLIGDNSLLLPVGGSGTLNGSVTFGAGADSVEINSGTITGAVDQGAGRDSFVITGGAVLGGVQQGGGVDDFRMTGGTIQSLNQGDDFDTFFMSDGRIIDFFDDGDRAVMTGGRIGRVNMKLANNVFDMSGGIIDRNLVTGFGDDTIVISGGDIGGNISVSGGVDSLTLTGGSIGGEVRMSAGDDSFVWDGGGIVYGAIDMGDDDDVAVLRNLTAANMGRTPAIMGGDGDDGLMLDNVTTAGVARFQGWESIALTNDTELTMDGALVLGDAGSGTGVLSIDATSTLFGGGLNGSISPFLNGSLARVVNAGRIDLTNGAAGAGDRFTIAGDYVGAGGLVLLDTVLGDDSSASDRLVILGGSASGTTSLSILNRGGVGASTAVDGIMVVEAANGASTAGGAFALNGRVAAGAFEYFLFRGGVSQGTADNWYLRSTLVTPPPSVPAPQPAPAPPPLEPPVPAPPPQPPEPPAPPPPAPVTPPIPVPPEPTPVDPDPVDPAPPVQPADPAPVAPPAPSPAPPADPPPSPPPPEETPAPVPTPSAPPPTPDATPVEAEVVPLYRVEVPTYAVLPPAAYHLALSSLGTFHERRGDQALLDGGGALPNSWARVFGENLERKWSGTVSPTFDGNLSGFQLGQDLIGWGEGAHRIGILGGQSRMHGDVRGQALGWNDLAVGDAEIESDSLGLYWTHVTPTGRYLDVVVMKSWFDGRSRSSADVGIDFKGDGLTATLEGGYPIAVGRQWSLEPQAQVVWQDFSFEDQADLFSPVVFEAEAAWTARLGLRLQGDLRPGGMAVRPYLKADVWHGFGAEQRTGFGQDWIVSDLKGTSLELGGGVTAALTSTISLYASADYTTEIDGPPRKIVAGTIGVSIRW
jgi:outer membrane autotransporter protein